MAFRIEINSLKMHPPLYIGKDSVTVDGSIYERTTASFRVLDQEETAAYVKGLPVSIYDDDDELVFAGFIDSSKVERIAPAGGYLHSISCVDNRYLAEKRLLADSHINKTCGYIVNEILTNILSEEGVTLGEIQDGVTLPTFVSSYAKVSDVLDALAEKSAFIWDISFKKQLYFISRDTVVAPWTITPEYILKEPAPTLENSNPKYRNRQYMTGGKAQTDVQTESFVGDGILTTFSLQYPVALAPEITVNGVSQSVGIKDVDSGKQWYWELDSAVITQDSGGTKLLAADTLQVVYTGLFDMVVIADDATSIAAQAAVEGSTGIVEDAVEDTTVESLAEGLTTAQAKIAFYCMAGLRFTFTIFRSGLQAGQLVTINDPNFGLAAEEMLIESVRVERVNNHFEYTIKAVTGPAQGSWSKLFKTIADQAAGTDLALSGDAVVIAKSLTENIEDTQTLTVTSYSCPVPFPALYPNPALYPC